MIKRIFFILMGVLLAAQLVQPDRSGEETAEGEMPPANYAWIHRHARLTDAQRQQVVNWFNALPGGKGEKREGEVGEKEERGEDHDRGSGR